MLLDDLLHMFDICMRLFKMTQIWRIINIIIIMIMIITIIVVTIFKLSLKL